MQKYFLNPYIGAKYKEGINGKRVLVLGASFYCSLDGNKGRKKCKYYEDCAINQNSIKYNEKCPYNNGRLLSDSAEGEIDENGATGGRVHADDVVVAGRVRVAEKGFREAAHLLLRRGGGGAEPFACTGTEARCLGVFHNLIAQNLAVVGKAHEHDDVAAEARLVSRADSRAGIGAVGTGDGKERVAVHVGFLHGHLFGRIDAEDGFDAVRLVLFLDRLDGLLGDAVDESQQRCCHQRDEGEREHHVLEG